ncbi:hypothetical protein QP519_10435 [Weeksella virosa]|uniref:Uncharacterized protein n=1 Tax=Weeksella virosa (strain ATCC 43766 / DSM 16922 / JCM 21250 / CCUG 30538 / CDC 9751 / IAM 14551 / NBRC 16016 / NCTC 11634 / CL345/78) TaxID=865938 RepID=F0NXQ8_WEEVC|nr:hypothetical protein [Weeksella virosa]ADX66965.1 hypothetical protein Weevi_0243 [Weeksella virosa DSM 16922]MDK7375951.1 hypothetical protein [Weeksella virosa]VEH63306.1 Uncharacterised protein [Weeksella virosa]
MKLTIDQIQSLFNGLGIAQAVEIVSNTEEANKEFNADNILKSFVDSREAVYMAKFNEEVLPEKLKAVAGEFGGKLNGYIRKASNNQIPLVDLEKLTDADKISKLVEVLDVNKSKDTEEIREQLAQAIEAHNLEIEKIKTEYESKIKEADNRLTDYKVSEYLITKVLPEIPLIDGDNKIRASLLKNALVEKYHLAINEKGEVELRDKENIEKPILDPDKNTFIQPKQFATEFFGGLGIIKQDNRGSETETDRTNGNSDVSSMRGALDQVTISALDQI